MTDHNDRQTDSKCEGNRSITRTDSGYDVICDGCSFHYSVPAGGEARRILNLVTCEQHKAREARQNGKATA